MKWIVINTVADEIVFNLQMDSNDYGIDASNENILEILYDNEMKKY